MKSVKNILLLVPFFVLMNCTKDFIVKDISKDTVIILAPVNNLSTPQNNITFWWEEMDGAEKYKIQIVKPSFNAAQQVIIDTNIFGDKFNYSLNPGTYQWRIKGVNNGGSSQYTTYNLTIDTTSDLTTQLVITIAPANNFVTGNNTMNFSWNSLSAADNYQIQVLNSSSAIIKDTTTTLNSYTCSISSQGNYTWKVRAFNVYSITQYNTPNAFTIDLTAPPVSVINYPVHAASVKDTTDLKWSRGSIDTKYDSVYISIDSTFGSTVSSARVYATKIKINVLNPALPISGSYYWWRVKSVDSVGNKSGFSNKLKFKLIP